MRKQDKAVIVAGGISLLAVAGIIILKRLLTLKHRDYQDYYQDFHRHFSKKPSTEDQHGIEFLAMQ